MYLSNPRKTLFGILIAAALFMLSSTASATHFQYGQINWQPEASTDISFTIQNAWRRSAYSTANGRCIDLSTLGPISCTGAGGFAGLGDVIVEFQGGTRFDPGDGSGLIGSPLGPLLYVITGINPITNSIFGLALDPASLPTVDTSLSHSYPTTGDYTAAIDTCCRMSPFDGTSNEHINNPNGRYRIETIVNVGSGNSSPTSTMPELVLCPIDDICNFIVPGVDPEGPITFRLSTSAEAAGFGSFVQPGPPDATNSASIDLNSGVYTWDTTGATLAAGAGNNTLYSTQVTIEDLDGSKVAVDFFIQLVIPDLNPPFFTTDLGAVCNSTQIVSIGDTLNFAVEAVDNDIGDIIALNVVGLPAGAEMTPSLPIGGNPVSSAFSWTPLAGDAGLHVVNFSATSSSGGQTLCPVTVNVPAQTSDDTARDVPTPLGDDIPVVDIDVFEQIAAEVVVAGSTNADFCVAPDPRESFIANGSGKKDKGKGKANGASNGNGGASVFQPRDLFVSELAGTGTCTGLLEFPKDAEDTWEKLLAQIDLTVASRYRGFVGTVDDEEAVWLVVGVVRSTAEYDGPVTIVGIPEALIDYTDPEVTLLGQNPLPGTSLSNPGACGNDSDWRPLNLGGAVAAFGDFENVEGNTMIVESVQCNRDWGITRRTTHIFPVRLDGPGGSSGKENENLRVQLDGIQGTLGWASFCANPDLISTMQVSLDDARNAVDQKRYEDAKDSLELISELANHDDDFDDGIKVGFDECNVNTNYRGNFISRGLSAAFTVHDRFLHPDEFEPYVLPPFEDVGVESPL